MKKYFKLYLIMMLALPLALVINSCQDSGSSSSQQPVSYNTNNTVNLFPDLTLPSMGDYSGVLSGGTIDQELTLTFNDAATQTSSSKKASVQCGNKGKDHNGRGDKEDKDNKGNDDHNRDKGHNGDNNDHHKNGDKEGINPLGQILSQLSLTQDQIDSIHTLRAQYHDCMQSARQQIHDRQMQIIADANAQRRQICQDLKNHVITRAEARQKLAALMQETKDALHPDGIQPEIQACVCDFLQNIVNVLNPQQAVDFIDWVNTNHPEFAVCNLQPKPQGPPVPPTN